MTKKTWLVIISLLVGLIFSIPNLVPFVTAVNRHDIIFTPLNGGDENLYASQIKQILDKKYSSLSPHLPWFGPIVLAGLVKIIGSIDLVFILADFLFPIIIFLLLYKLVFQITKHFSGSILAGLSTLFLYHLTTKFPPINLTRLQKFWETLTLSTPYFFSFNRLIPPQLTFIIFSLFLINLYQSITQSRKIFPILTGLLAGLLAYNYFFEWSAALVILGLSFIFFRSRRLGLALIIALIISTPYLYQALYLSSLDTQIMFGRINGRFFEPLTTFRYLIFSLLVFFYSPKKLKYFLLSLALAPVFLMNQQLITGLTIHPGHWLYGVFEPLAPLIVLIILSTTFKSWFEDNYKTGLLVIPILIYALVNQFKITLEGQSLNYLKPEETKLFNWLETQSSPGVVLTLDKRLNRYLAVYSPDDLYLPYGSYSRLSLDQLWQKINLAFFIYQLSPEAITQTLSSTQFIGQMFDQAYNYHKLSNLNGLIFPDQVKAKIIKQSPVLTLGTRYLPDNLKQLSLEKTLSLTKDNLCDFALNYVILGELENNLSAQLDQSIFSLSYQNPQFQVFKLKPEVCYE